MKYENACDVLPEELLKEVQKYAAGKLLYIPSGDEKKPWGESSGYRAQLKRRNLMICNKYAHGMTISELADEYFLSLDSIKKIIYSKKNDKSLTYAPNIISAVQYANVGMVEEWMQCYLLFSVKVTPALSALVKEDPIYFGVVKLPLRLVQRDGLCMKENHDETNLNITDRAPLIIRYDEGKLYSVVQQELLAALKQRGVNAYPTIIVLKRSADYKRFMKQYGQVLFFVDAGE
ncbi:CD3324 family protein [Paenibacillus sp. HJGM_3]|uniref:CD3324 family protein n=1 Tax=Paenibacillus sp. HJGM_3 TaxID=3379816 RepID=UPI00385C82D0